MSDVESFENLGDVERSLAFLDALPDTLYGPVVVSTGATLERRVAGVVQMRELLLAGGFVADAGLGWPEDMLLRALDGMLRELGLHRFCEGEPELVDAILKSFLEAVAHGWVAARPAFDGRLEAWGRRELKLEEATLRAQESDRPEWFPLPEADQEREADTDGEREHPEVVRARARMRADALEATKERLREEWRARAELWSSLADVLDDLKWVLRIGWDMSKGVLGHSGWFALERLQALLEQAGSIRELAQVLGRWRQREALGEEVDILQVLEHVSIVGRKPITTSLVPQETRGVTRSGDVSRMLPAEAALLLHPKLRVVWHARRAERALNTYRVQGVMDGAAGIIEELREVTEERPRREERGPIMVCLDTSGSMRGLPEWVAKAITLELMRIAHREDRACYLYVFSGPGDVAEHELSLDASGLDSLLGLLAMSFHGGTDVHEPIQRAMARAQGEEAERWSGADLVLITDGGFGVSRSLQEELEEVRERTELKVHGVLVGTNSRALEVLCDEVHTFEDWSKLRGV